VKPEQAVQKSTGGESLFLDLTSNFIASLSCDLLMPQRSKNVVPNQICGVQEQTTTPAVENVRSSES
jgi:hypothetical protein